MSQIVRPTTSAAGPSGAWSIDGGAANVHSAINDESDSTYIYATTTKQSYGQLGDLTDPAVNTGHVFWWRESSTNATGVATLELYQGNPTGAGDLIISQSLPESETPTTGSVTLSEAEAANITDYTDLWWWIERGTGTFVGILHELAFEVPDAPQTEEYGIATETDTARPFVSRKGAGYNLSSETDEALAFVATKLAAYGIAEETDLALGVRDIITFGTAEEVDAALAFVSSKAKLAEYLEALETDTALPFVAHKHPGGGAYFPMGSVHSPFMLKPPPTRRRRNR